MQYDPFIFGTWRKRGDKYVRGAISSDPKGHPITPYSCHSIADHGKPDITEDNYWARYGFTADAPIVEEWIERAAIQWKGQTFSVPAPGRHHDVIAKIDAPESEWPVTGVQGFITSEKRFVDREEGFLIAKAAGQIIFNDPVRNPYRISAPDAPKLYSEDLW